MARARRVMLVLVTEYCERAQRTEIHDGTIWTLITACPPARTRFFWFVTWREFEEWFYGFEPSIVPVIAGSWACWSLQVEFP